MAVDERGDNVPIFGVDDRQRPHIANGFQGAQQLAVGQAQPIGHVKLETAATRGAYTGHLVELGDVAGADGHVQAVIDCSFAGSQSLAGGQGVEHGLIRRGLHKVNNGRRTAEGRGARAVVEVVGGDEAADGHLQMDVDINAAGDNIFAGGVDLASSVEIATHGGNGFAADGYIGGKDSLGRDKRTVFDDQVVRGTTGGKEVFRHNHLPCSSLTAQGYSVINRSP